MNEHGIREQTLEQGILPGKETGNKALTSYIYIQRDDLVGNRKPSQVLNLSGLKGVFQRSLG